MVREPGGSVPGHSHYIPLCSEIILYFAARRHRGARALSARYISRAKLVFLFWIKVVTAHFSAMRPLSSLLLLCSSYGVYHQSS